MTATVRRRIDEFIGDDMHGQRYYSSHSREELDYIIKATVEATLAALSKGLFSELRAINERLDRIEARLENLERLVKSRGYSRGKGRGGISDSVAELLASDGYIIGSASRSKLGISPQRLLSIVSDLDNAVVVDAGIDFIVFTRNSLDRFKRMLREVNVNDPYEAALKLGRFGDAFNILRTAGLVYYDGKHRSWRMLE